MGEDLDNTLTPDQAAEPEQNRSPEEILLDKFQFTLFELLKQATSDPEHLGARVAGFAQTFLDEYHGQLTEKQVDEIFYARNDYLVGTGPRE